MGPQTRELCPRLLGRGQQKSRYTKQIIISLCLVFFADLEVQMRRVGRGKSTTLNRVTPSNRVETLWETDSEAREQ